MRRVRLGKEPAREVSLPVWEAGSKHERRMFEPTMLGPIASACLRCPDAPCVSFSDEELARQLSVETPLDPDPHVCPTNAIRQDGSGLPLIDRECCVGCGLCVQRCPVGAISLDKNDTAARVCVPQAPHYAPQAYDARAFLDLRGSLAGKLVPEAAPFTDAGLAGLQQARLEAALSKVDAQRFYRLFVRNVFLLHGLPARLRNVGDNTAPWTELAVGCRDTLFLFEIEPGPEALDAFRRAIAGVATLSSSGVSLDHITPSVVLARLPNERVDYYRVLKYVREALGVRVRTLPITALLLAVRGGEVGLTLQLVDACYVEETLISLQHVVGELFGAIDDVEGVGLAIIK